MFSSNAKAIKKLFDDEFIGNWVPVNQSCNSSSRIIIKPYKIKLINGNNISTFESIDLCYSCAGGVRYAGIEV